VDRQDAAGFRRGRGSRQFEWCGPGTGHWPTLSHAVTNLERALGAPVFVRSHGGVALTPVGERLHRAVSLPYATIDRSVHEIQRGRSDQTVTLSVSSSLASFWLMPRLPGFKRQHPEVDLRVLTTDGDSGVGRDDVDVWIPLGTVSSPGLDSVDFCVERVVPVAAPEAAHRLAAWSTRSELADALAGAPLLTLLERYVTRFDWDRWFRAADREVPINAQGYASNDYSLVVQAALDGQGVALGWAHIVADLVAAVELHRSGLQCSVYSTTVMSTSAVMPTAVWNPSPSCTHNR